MDTTLIPIFPIIIFSLHHKSFTSLSTVKLYFQKKIIQNTFWIYANQNHTGKMHSPRSLNKLQKLQFMQKNHLHQFAPHYPLEHFPPFKLPQRSLCFACILESCSCTLATTPCEETRSQGPAGRPESFRHRVPTGTGSWELPWPPWPCCKQPRAAFSPAPKQTAAM